MRAKNIIIIMLIAGSAAVSFFFSREIYRFHMMAYYTILKGQDYSQMMKKAEELYKKKEYVKARSLLEDVLLIYENRRDAVRLMGMNYMKAGDRRRGVEMIVSTLDGGRVDMQILRETIPELYRQKLYGDIIDIAGRYLRDDDYLVNYYYGVSLYHLKFYDKAIDRLKRAESSGSGMLTQELKADLYYYMALSYEETGRFGEALRYLDRSEKLSESDKITTRARVRIYRKTGDFRRAERQLRSQRKRY